MRTRFYAASKTKHAGMWRAIRDTGMPIHSSWIDEAEEGQTESYSELAQRCAMEIHESAALVLFCMDGDVLKGALIEAGMALALGKDVYCVGTCASISRVFAAHPNWHAARDVMDAYRSIRAASAGARP